MKSQVIFMPISNCKWGVETTKFIWEMSNYGYGVIASTPIQIYIMLISGEPIYEGTRTTQVINPAIIVEVLSKLTLNYEKIDNFRSYRCIPELKEYIIINQYEYFVSPEYFRGRSYSGIHEQPKGLRADFSSKILPQQGIFPTLEMRSRIYSKS
jgi:hypothetical protein